MKTIITVFERQDLDKVKLILTNNVLNFREEITPKEIMENDIYCNTCLLVNGKKENVEQYLTSLTEYGLYEWKDNKSLDLSPKIRQIIKKLKDHYLDDSNEYNFVLSFSGGKDSTMLLLLVWLAISEIPLEKRIRPIYVITSDTGLEPKNMASYMKKVVAAINSAAKEQQMPIQAQLVKPKLQDRFGPKVIGAGVKPSVPGQPQRSCTDWWKIRPSDEFIKSCICEKQSSVVFTGVRISESENRAASIARNGNKSEFIFPKRNGKGKIIKGLYSCHAIKDLLDYEVWESLKKFDVFPWGITYKELLSHYGDSGECPMQVEVGMNTCGNSRNGCTICMYVKDDKMLQWLISKGETWAESIMEFRNKMKAMLFDANFRRNPSKHKTKHYLDRFNPFYESKEDVIKGLNQEGKGSSKRIRLFEQQRRIKQSEFEEQSNPLCKSSTPVYPDLELGSFNLQARIFLLKNVLYYQSLAGMELVSDEDIDYIKEQWKQEFGWKENEEDLRPEALDVPGSLNLNKDYAINRGQDTTIPNLHLPSEHNYKNGKPRVLNRDFSNQDHHLFYIRRDFGLDEQRIIDIMTRAEMLTGETVPYFFSNGWNNETATNRVFWNTVIFVVAKAGINSKEAAHEWVEAYLQNGMEKVEEPNWDLYLKEKSKTRVFIQQSLF